jgi:hypothetical protein
MDKRSKLSRLIALMPQAIAELESEGRDQAACFVNANKLLFEEYFMPTMPKPKVGRQLTT